LQLVKGDTEREFAKISRKCSQAAAGIFKKVSGLPSEVRSQHFKIPLKSIKLKCKGIMES